jgi:outer membrane protein OmpA-like peptidoglycan-associated protein
MADVIASREFAQLLEVATFAGYEIRGNPDGLDAPNGSYRWGTGVAFPSRTALRFSAEVNGDLPTDYRATLTNALLVANDGSTPPFDSDVRNGTRATGGVTYQMPAGFYVGTGLSWNAPRHWDWQMRVGFHGRGRDRARPLASNEPGPSLPITRVAETPLAPLERALVGPEPARVEAALSPAPVAPVTPVPAPATAQAEAPRSYSFDDVYFNLDGVTPRPEAASALEDAMAAMVADPTLTMTIEGHTCDIGTAMYNLALAQRRADGIRDYFVHRGIAASRLRTVSYGEDDPEFANGREATRRLNRRVALVVKLQP